MKINNCVSLHSKCFSWLTFIRSENQNKLNFERKDQNYKERYMTDRNPKKAKFMKSQLCLMSWNLSVVFVFINDDINNCL